MNETENKVILIVDDSEPNRSLLRDMLRSKYSILEAIDGEDAIHQLEKKHDVIDLILLDVMMPKIDGFGVLERMEAEGWIENIPVVMISSDTSAKSINRGYALGSTDYISRPFNHNIVKRRVENTLLLFEKQKGLMDLVKEQVSEKEESNARMIRILSTVVEFRNGESGSHILQIRVITKILLDVLRHRHPEYLLTQVDVANIVTASALHDIGKICIPEGILNKPGKLTKEEFEVMKGHSAKGEEILRDMDDDTSDAMFEYAKMICRWHHERFDGNGYPDGLIGEEIPIAAQIVALADVYDALVSERVYKPPFSHEEAFEMILNGECGAFNPDVLECLESEFPKIKKTILENSELKDQSLINPEMVSKDMIMRRNETLSNRTISLIEEERIKYQFLASLSTDALFDYDTKTDHLVFSGENREAFGLPDFVENLTQLSGGLGDNVQELVQELRYRIKETTPEQPFVNKQCKWKMADGSTAWCQVTARSLWHNDNTEDQPSLRGAIGKIININDEHRKLSHFQKLAMHDSLTKLLNPMTAQTMIKEDLEMNPDSIGVYIFFDVDDFKKINDNKGHNYGDLVLQYIASVLKKSTRSDDITARIGGDEFLIVLRNIQDETIIKKQVERIYQALLHSNDDYELSVSMGVAISPKDGSDYTTLVKHADLAMYAAKKNGKHSYQYYDSSMKEFD